ncbi:MAG: hypothetical protein UT05_C0001G0003 [Parcubacteria group bacterium GW2011_GWF2_38_76]|nr:MAG: hypothetical protein UT05_C0001G0003 [Parcubacteria group bacterium GW2011_GWF2_38_76]HBM46020.1 hypothetical protein [Patescibacteria group bacterium]
MLKKRLTVALFCLLLVTVFIETTYAGACYEVANVNSIKIPNFMEKIPEMEKIFDDQIAELRSRGFGTEFLNELMIMRMTVTVKAAKLNIKEGNIPFIPAINVAYAFTGKCGDPTLKDDYKKIEIINKRQFLGLGELKDVDDRVCPYYIYDVSPGNDTLGLSPKEARAQLASSGRRSLNIIEGAFLFFLTNSISKNGMWFDGSRCGGKVPVVYVKDGKIYLDSEIPDNKYIDRGVTSCIVE